MKFLPDQVVARLQSEMQTPDLAGTRYRALRFLGHGGMGSVWRRKTVRLIWLRD